MPEWPPSTAASVHLRISNFRLCYSDLFSISLAIWFIRFQEREEKRKTIFGTQKEITEGGQDLLNEMNPFFDLLDEVLLSLLFFLLVTHASYCSH